MPSAPLPPGRKRRSVVPRLALALAGALLGLVAADRALVAFDPLGTCYFRDVGTYLRQSVVPVPSALHRKGRLFENRRGTHTRLTRFAFDTNGSGLRVARATEAGVPGRSEEDRLRVLFLGDSVTLGWGADHAATFVQRIEEEARALDGRGLRTMNAGHLMYDTVQEADWLRAHGPGLDPDLIVLTVVANDAALTFEEVERERGRIAGPTRRRPLLEGLRGAFRGLDGLRMHFAARRVAARVRSGTSWIAAPDRVARSMPAVHAALDELLATARGLGAELLVLDHARPRLPGVAAWCESRGVPWHDFTFTAAEWARPVRVSASDHHANALGHRLLAHKALRALAAEGWIRPGEAAPIRVAEKGAGRLSDAR